jgi:hypothetical protein
MTAGRKITMGDLKRWGIAWALAAGVALIGGCGDSGEEGAPEAASRTFYGGYQEDIKLMRKTEIRERRSGSATVSTLEAIGAANRIFSKIDFVGMSREEVLALLGDPGTISDYARPAAPDVDEPLAYCMTNGRYGATWVVEFKGGQVVNVKYVPHR